MLDRLERAVASIVDSGMAGIFRLRVQPAEIGRRLERAFLDGRVTSVGATLAPNLFDVHLHPDDAAAFADWSDALSRELETWLAELAFARGVATVGPMRVRIVEDREVRRRSVHAVGRFGAAAEPRVPSRPRALRLVPSEPGSRDVILRQARVTVGRAAGSGLCIAAPEVSRRHAAIEWSDSGWRIVDLDSTNGTWLNGERIREGVLAPGDELSFGGVRFTVQTE